MVYYLKWIFWATVWILVAGFLHYTLPQYDIVRIADTEIRRVDFGENSIFWAQADSGQPGTANRDVRFINTKYPDGSNMVFRNEDTGWGWPPYFKLDSSNLHTDAADLRSTLRDPRWVAVKHYGWRNEIISIFPNAISIRAVEGPDVRIINWTSITILILLGAVVWFVTARWIRFKRRRIAPVMDDLDARYDAGTARFSTWLGSWRRKPR